MPNTLARPRFCAKCHRRVPIPKYLLNGMLKLADTGVAKIGCPHCGNNDALLLRPDELPKMQEVA